MTWSQHKEEKHHDFEKKRVITLTPFFVAKVEMPKIGYLSRSDVHLYLSGMWFGVAPRMDNKKTRV